MPAVTRDHYFQGRVAIALDPEERILSWDNARIAIESETP
jgi:hypothetical protein